MKLHKYLMLLSWIDATAGTADYFNNCDLTNTVSVPLNFVGFQNAWSGNGYAGIFVAQTGGPAYREYLEVALSEPLLANRPYSLVWYVSLANESSCAPNSVCVFLADEFIYDYTTTGILSQPSSIVHTICNDPSNTFDDTINWEMIKTCFIATGTEKYLVIGNSYSDYFSGCYNTDGTGFLTAYLYIDNVVLEPMPVQTIYFDTIIC